MALMSLPARNCELFSDHLFENKWICQNMLSNTKRGPDMFIQVIGLARDINSYPGSQLQKGEVFNWPNLALRFFPISSDHKPGDEKMCRFLKHVAVCDCTSLTSQAKSSSQDKILCLKTIKATSLETLLHLSLAGRAGPKCLNTQCLSCGVTFPPTIYTIKQHETASAVLRYPLLQFLRRPQSGVESSGLPIKRWTRILYP